MHAHEIKGCACFIQPIAKRGTGGESEPRDDPTSVVVALTGEGKGELETAFMAGFPAKMIVPHSIVLGEYCSCEVVLV